MIILYIGIGIIILLVLLFIFSDCKVAGEADRHIDEAEEKLRQGKNKP